MTTMLKQHQLHKSVLSAGFTGLFAMPINASKPMAGIWLPGQGFIVSKNRHTSLARGGGNGF